MKAQHRDDCPHPMHTCICEVGRASWRYVKWHNIIGKPLRDIAIRSGAEHEQQYFHGGCPECGIFYDPEFDWQHLDGCSRTSVEEPSEQ